MHLVELTKITSNYELFIRNLEGRKIEHAYN